MQFTITTTDYSNGIEYKNNAINAIYHSEGRLTQGTGVTPFAQPRYEYALSDHLGNGRVYYTDQNANGVGDVSDILQDNHYYPFGLNHNDPRRNTGGVGVNLYQYNGKELVEDNGLGWNAYGKRYYDATLGRFPNVDPLIDTFHFVTGYNYAENEPVAHIDLWGLQKFKMNLKSELTLGPQIGAEGNINNIGLGGYINGGSLVIGSVNADVNGLSNAEGKAKVSVLNAQDVKEGKLPMQDGFGFTFGVITGESKSDYTGNIDSGKENVTKESEAGVAAGPVSLTTQKSSTEPNKTQVGLKVSFDLKLVIGVKVEFFIGAEY